MTHNILCVGFCCVDVLVRGTSNDADPYGVVPAHDVTLCPGGDAVNEAIILSKLGNQVQLMTGLGKDAGGKLVELVVCGEGVDTSLCPKDPNHKTSVNVILVDAQGDRTYISEPLSPSLQFAIPPEKLRGFKIVSLASLFFPPLDRPEVVLQVVKQAKEAGSLVCADVMCLSVDASTMAAYQSVWPYIDYLFPNEEEAQALTGLQHPEEMADVFRSYGVGHVVVKLGGRGCFAKSASFSGMIPGFAAKCVDTTGAGDSFAAGFQTALLEGYGFATCCRFGNAAGSLAIQAVGASAGIQNRRQLDALLSTDGSPL